VLVLESARVRPLARRLQLDEADQQVLLCHRKVGARLEFLNRRLADEDNIGSPSKGRDDSLDQHIQGATKLSFG
jgi:hypothetical protein